MLINLTDSSVLLDPPFSSGGQSERKIKQCVTKEGKNRMNQLKTQIKLQQIKSLITVKLEQQSRKVPRSR